MLSSIKGELRIDRNFLLKARSISGVGPVAVDDALSLDTRGVPPGLRLIAVLRRVRERRADLGVDNSICEFSSSGRDFRLTEVISDNVILGCFMGTLFSLSAMLEVDSFLNLTFKISSRDTHGTLIGLVSFNVADGFLSTGVFLFHVGGAFEKEDNIKHLSEKVLSLARKCKAAERQMDNGVSGV